MAFRIKSRQKKTIKNFSFRRKVYIFIICFFISSFIWILIKLSHDYQEIRKYHIVYTNFPADKIVVNDPDSVFTLNLKSKGFRIFSNMLFFKPRILTIDVGSLLKKKKNSNMDFYILTSELYQVIGGQIGYTNNVIAINPDTVYFRMEKSFSKKVPVRAKINVSFASQYELDGSLKCEPENVIVSGPKAVIDTIRFVETASKNLTNITGNQNFSICFAKKYNDVNLKIEPVQEKIFIPVDKFTEDTLNIPVAIENNTNNYIVRTFPEKVKVTYLVSLGNYKKVKSDMFSLVADISKAVSEKQNKLKVEIAQSPSFVKIQKIDPEKIEYILIK
jgi:hypothetical protein